MRPPDPHQTRMDHTGIDDEQTAERYALGRLPETERQSFEEHLLDCPRCLDAVESAEGIRDGLGNLSAGPAAAHPESSVVAFAPRRPLARPLVTLLAAACVPLAVLSGLFFSQTRAARRDLEDSRTLLQQSERRRAEVEGELGRERSERARSADALASLRAAPLFLLETTRGAAAETENRLVLPDSGEWVTLAFDRPPGDARDHRVRIAHADGKPVGDASPTGAASGRLLAVSLPAASLTPGDYVVTVERPGADRTETLATYRFRASRKP